MNLGNRWVYSLLFLFFLGIIIVSAANINREENTITELRDNFRWGETEVHNNIIIIEGVWKAFWGVVFIFLDIGLILGYYIPLSPIVWQTISILIMILLIIYMAYPLIVELIDDYRRKKKQK